MIEFVVENLPKLLNGTLITLQIVPLSLLLGFVLAIGVAQMRVSNNLIIQYFARGYVYIFRSTPLLVQLFLIYYGSGQFRPFLQDIGLWVLFRDPYFCTVLALTLNTTAYTSEIIRGGIQSVPWGQVEAARACGMSPLMLFRRIIFPIAIRQALPGYGNEIILMVKSSSLASTVTIMELLGTARQIASVTFEPIPAFVLAGAIYLTINFVVTRAVIWAEWKLNPHLRERPRMAARGLGEAAKA